MVSHDQRNTVVRVHLAPQLSQTPSDPQHGLRGRAAQGKNHSRLYDFQLAMKIWNTGRDLIRQGLSILGRATLDNVSDVYRLARQFDSLQDAVEQVSGLTHERSALRVLGGPRSLSDEKEFRVGIPLARDGVDATGTETAAVCRPNPFGDFFDGAER